MKLFKFLMGCVIFLVAFSIVAAAYERFNGGPWYTFVNAGGDRVIMGQDVRTTYNVYNADGKLVDTVPGWKFEDQAPNSYVRDNKGELHYQDPVLFPKWLKITETALYPFLKAGHFIVDNVVNFFKMLM
jgi:hypothetical protein